MQPSNQEHRYEELAAKWLNGTITPEEEKEFAGWFNDGNSGPMLVPEALGSSEEAHRRRLLNKVRQAAGLQHGKTVRMRRWAIAASLALVAGAAALYLLRPSATAPRQMAIQQPAAMEDAAPGGNKAVLTLANGSQIVLDSAGQGVLATQGGTAVIKSQQGQLVYKEEENTENTAAVAMNTLRTPRGGQYMIVLPDGTKVWLNSQSSLQFPAVFNGKERVVQLTGEAYFEVAHNKQKPFRVASAGAHIEVLGTHFNVMAYANEPHMETTLLEGAVRVSKGSRSEVIKPGRQVQLSGSEMTVRSVDTDDAIAWKTGLFRFNNHSLKSIMRQIERWYDVQIDYASMPDKEYSGMMRRTSNLSEVLKMLEVAGRVRFTIEGRTVRAIQ
ncbi:FecR family protein [Chitinophaga alhagiae]|uniref:FecR family protein n=1 Tax=Chitinophaga alhagiae TaxID=2203219 RepID=UPI000E5C2A65|nr:FecR family protein [Chitinophaga alhagiae]